MAGRTFGRRAGHRVPAPCLNSVVAASFLPLIAGGPAGVRSRHASITPTPTLPHPGGGSCLVPSPIQGEGAVWSPPPCGEGLGWGARDVTFASSDTAHLTPPHRGKEKVQAGYQRT